MSRSLRAKSASNWRGFATTAAGLVSSVARMPGMALLLLADTGAEISASITSSTQPSEASGGVDASVVALARRAAVNAAAAAVSRWNCILIVPRSYFDAPQAQPAGARKRDRNRRLVGFLLSSLDR